MNSNKPMEFNPHDFHVMSIEEPSSNQQVGVVTLRRGHGLVEFFALLFFSFVRAIDLQYFYFLHRDITHEMGMSPSLAFKNNLKGVFHETAIKGKA